MSSNGTSGQLCRTAIECQANTHNLQSKCRGKDDHC